MGRAAALAALALAPGLLAAQTKTGPPPLGLDLFMPSATDEPTKPALIALGRRLFFDPILSRDSTLACASCHRPDQAFADGRSVSVGVFGRRGTRNVPAIINRGWGKAFFWDGRIPRLEDQVLEPISAPAEMGMSVEDVVGRLQRDRVLRERFRQVFGDAVNREALARALAAYVRSIRAGESRFDQAMHGDLKALNEREQLGLQLFQGRARCAQCHLGALLTDESFHNTGIAWRNGAPADSGRALVTGRAQDLGAFKTPTLRQILSTAPYMHDGSLRTLEEVVDFYNQGGHRNPYIDPELRPLGLTSFEKGALLAFLRSLEGRIEEGTTRVHR